MTLRIKVAMFVNGDARVILETFLHEALTTLSLTASRHVCAGTKHAIPPVLRSVVFMAVTNVFAVEM
jgi:hypothetical protein